MIRCLEAKAMDKRIGGAYQFIANLKSAENMHDHDFYEFFLITKGSAKHNVNGKIQNLREGSLVFIRPSDCHTYDKNTDIECQFINVVFSKLTLEKILDCFDNDFPIEELINAPLPPVVHLMAGEKSMLKATLEELNLFHQSDITLLKIKLRSILIEIFTKYFINLNFSNINTDSPKWLKKLYVELQKPTNFKYGLSYIENNTNKSKEHICRCFKKYLNTTPTAYINQLRINYAANLLCYSDFEIIDICFDCGFQNLSHFYHLFKKEYDISPAKFRKTNKRNSLIS